MKTEDLKALGLDEETIKKVFSLNGKDIEELKKQIADKDKELTNANSEKESITKNLDEVKEKLKGFDGVDVEGLNKQIKDLQDKMDAQAKQFESEKLERAFNDKLDSFIAKKNGKNATAIKSLLDVATLKDSKNQDADIESALDSVAKDNDYLFGTNEPIKKPVASTGGNSGNGGTAIDEEKVALARKVMGLAPKE